MIHVHAATNINKYNLSTNVRYAHCRAQCTEKEQFIKAHCMHTAQFATTVSEVPAVPRRPCIAQRLQKVVGRSQLGVVHAEGFCIDRCRASV